MKSIFAVAVLAATTEASMTAGKAHYLQSKGVHMENLHAKHAKVVERATHTKNAVQKNATALRTKHQQKLSQTKEEYDEFGNPIPPKKQDQEEGLDIPDEGEDIKPDAYYENLIYGVIDGLTADFDTNCADSMYGVVNGGFRAKDYKNIVDPRNSVKFQMAMNQLTESTNSVYAFCDFTHFYSQLAMLADTENWEQYIQIGSRVGGSMIQSVPTLMNCIDQGKAGGNGYDVGICGGGIASLFLDTLL